MWYVYACVNVCVCVYMCVDIPLVSANACVIVLTYVFDAHEFSGLWAQDKVYLY